VSYNLATLNASAIFKVKIGYPMFLLLSCPSML
jgi:hypothetical protein